MERMLYAAGVLASVALGLLSYGCQSSPTCSACGFSANSQVVITDSSGHQTLGTTNSSGCYMYACGRSLTIIEPATNVQINTGHVS